MKNIPIIELKVSCHDQFCIEEENLDLVTMRILRSLVINRQTSYKNYDLFRNAEPFLQGYDENFGWILIEFWNDDGIEEFIEFANKEIRSDIKRLFMDHMIKNEGTL